MAAPWCYSSSARRRRHKVSSPHRSSPGDMTGRAAGRFKACEGVSRLASLLSSQVPFEPLSDSPVPKHSTPVLSTAHRVILRKPIPCLSRRLVLLLWLREDCGGGIPLSDIRQIQRDSTAQEPVSLPSCLTLSSASTTHAAQSAAGAAAVVVDRSHTRADVQDHPYAQHTPPTTLAGHRRISQSRSPTPDSDAQHCRRALGSVANLSAAEDGAPEAGVGVFFCSISTPST